MRPAKYQMAFIKCQYTDYHREEGWYQQLGGNDAPLTDGILDRIVHDAYRIEIELIDPSKDISMVSAKYSCGFSNPQISPIIATDRYLDYFTTIMEDRLWQVLARPAFRWWNRSDLSMNAVRAA